MKAYVIYDSKYGNTKIGVNGQVMDCELSKAKDLGQKIASIFGS